jgi:uncharacterized protein YkvS
LAEDMVVAEKTEENVKVNKANVGDTIEIKRGIKKGKKGTVVIVREKSVIVEIGTNPNTGEPIKTVVNHKNYKVIKRAKS